MNNSEALWQKAIEFHQAGNLESATDWYIQTIKAEPRRAEAWNNLGVIYRDGGNLVAALACFRRAVKLAPDFATFQMNMGDMFLRMARPDDAKIYLKEDHLRAAFEFFD
ncbi:MAG: tetratricopeptide repeat protein, partial [Bdellovibrionota bacterium]